MVVPAFPHQTPQAHAEPRVVARSIATQLGAGLSALQQPEVYEVPLPPIPPPSSPERIVNPRIMIREMDKIRISKIIKERETDKPYNHVYCGSVQILPRRPQHLLRLRLRRGAAGRSHAAGAPGDRRGRRGDGDADPHGAAGGGGDRRTRPSRSTRVHVSLSKGSVTKGEGRVGRIGWRGSLEGVVSQRARAVLVLQANQTEGFVSLPWGSVHGSLGSRRWISCAWRDRVQGRLQWVQSRWRNPQGRWFILTPHLKRTCRGASAIYSETTVSSTG